jgi:hypothetical protein
MSLTRSAEMALLPVGVMRGPSIRDTPQRLPSRLPSGPSSIVVVLSAWAVLQIDKDVDQVVKLVAFTPSTVALRQELLGADPGDHLRVPTTAVTHHASLLDRQSSTP